MVVQWLRLHAFTAVGMALILLRELKSHMLCSIAKIIIVKDSPRRKDFGTNFLVTNPETIWEKYIKPKIP